MSSQIIVPDDINPTDSLSHPALYNGTPHVHVRNRLALLGVNQL